MKDFLSKEHYCYKIHTLLMKGSAYPHLRGQFYSVHPLLSVGGWGRAQPPTKFSRRGSLTGSQILKGYCWERGDNSF